MKCKFFFFFFCEKNKIKSDVGPQTCQEHWNIQSASAGNPNINYLVVSKSSAAGSVFGETLFCFCKVNLPELSPLDPFDS